MWHRPSTVLASLFALTVEIATAQSGLVTAEGLPLPGAIVSLTNGVVSIHKVTDQRGRFDFGRLTPSEWTVTVEMVGFTTNVSRLQITRSSGRLAPVRINLRYQPPSQNTAAAAAATLASGVEGAAASGSITTSAQEEPSATEFTTARLLKNSDADLIDASQRRSSPLRQTQSKSSALPFRVRGTAAVTFRNSTWDARPVSFSTPSAPKRPYSSAIGVASLTVLPTARTSSHWLPAVSLNINGTRNRSLFSAIGRVPTPDELMGRFSASAALVMDPTGSTAPFPHNIIPFSRLNHAALVISTLFPAPTSINARQNYAYTTVVPLNSTSGFINIAKTIPKVGAFSLTIARAQRAGARPQFYGFRDSTSGGNYNVDLRWTLERLNHQVLQLSISSSRVDNATLPFYAQGGPTAQEAGIDTVADDANARGLPTLQFTNSETLRDGNPIDRHKGRFAVEGLTKFINGTHELSVGGQLAIANVAERPNIDTRGTLAFTGIRTSSFDQAGVPLAGTGYDLADFMLGLPQSSGIRYTPSRARLSGVSSAVFVENDWHPRSNVTVNVGARWEFASPVAERSGRLSNVLIGPSSARLFTGLDRGQFPRSLIYSDINNIAPRLSLAVRLGGMILRTGFGMYYNTIVYEKLASSLFAQPPFASTGTAQTSTKNPLYIETALRAASQAKSLGNTMAIDPRYRVGVADSWVFSVQRDITKLTFVDIRYLGTKGTHLDTLRIGNQAALGSPLNADDRRPILDLGPIVLETSDGNSSYHAAQIQFVRRWVNGLSGSLNYTFGKAIDNAANIAGTSVTVAQNANDLRSERALSAFDARHTLDLRVRLSIDHLPGPAHYMAGLRSIIGSFTVGSDVMFRTGRPLTARVLGNRSDATGTGYLGSARPNATGETINAPSHLFNTAAFALPYADAFGNAGRNTIPSPSSLIVNGYISRLVSLGDNRRNLEFRLEGTNLTNSVNVTNMGTTINALDYGLPTEAAGMRTLQLSMRMRF